MLDLAVQFATDPDGWGVCDVIIFGAACQRRLMFVG